MTSSRTTVFGGSGFLGRRIVARLVELGHRVRVASRHPEHSRALFPDAGEAVEPVAADVNDDRSVADAVAGTSAVVNAVSLYVERHDQTFRSVHVEAAGRVAERARHAGTERLVHISGIGADATSSSSYIRSRGEGERAVRDRFEDATIVRPAVMFGADDAFVAPVAALLQKLPAFAMFGRGRTRLQPAWVEDVALGIARALQVPDKRRIYEFAGPRVYTYNALLRAIRDRLGRRTALVPVPFGVWHGIAALAEQLPNPPITRNQIELMEVDNVADPAAPGFEALGITPASLDDVLPDILRR